MSDLISRQEAIDSLTEIIMNLKNVYGDMGSAVNGARECIKSLSSVEPERNAKVEYIAEVYRGEVFDHYLSGICGICGEYAYDHAKYCSDCGAKLDWSGNDKCRKV